ncbi:MAG: phage/plasmid replication protein [Ferruginibacter sp.]
MIDTVVLKIHNIDKYPKIYEQYYNPQQKKGSITQAYVNEDTGEITEDTFLAAHIFHDSNRVLPTVHRNTLNIASSHYSLSYLLNPAQNCLEFNFSIPKYVYSTNVIQFINIFAQDSNTTFTTLMVFLHKFLKENFLQTPLYEDVEINRIDLCYNQFFNSENDAMQYLDEQKNLLKEYARSSKNNYRSYDTSFMYITRRYSFKVYHKGTEFKKKDFYQLAKKNPLNLPIQYLQDQANTILRYEMTFRKGMLNYLRQQYFNVGKTKIIYEHYQQHPYPTFCRNLVANGHWKAYDLYNRKSTDFLLRSLFDSKLSYTYEQIIQSNSLTFDETFFRIVFQTFWDKVHQYQLQPISSLNAIQKKIDEHNENNRIKNTLRNKKASGMSTFRFMAAAMLIQKGMDISEFKSLISPRQYRRLKCDLAKLGLDKRSQNVDIPRPKTDYLDYKIFFGKFH